LIVGSCFVGCCFVWVGVEGRVRGVDCVCGTEAPCSSDNGVGDAGCAALAGAGALEKNTTLQLLHSLQICGECVVLCDLFFEGG